MLSKFNSYIYLPDFAYKFLSMNNHNVFVKADVYLKYIFTKHQSFNAIPIKAIMMLESVYPQRALLKSRLIFLKFSKSRCHSFIYVKLNLKEIFSFLPFFVIKPNSTRTLKSFLSSSRYFSFPGFISHLRFPSWTRAIQFSVDSINPSYKYTYLFHKISYLD